MGFEKIRDAVCDFVRLDDGWSDAQTNGNGEIKLLRVIKKAKSTVLIGRTTKAKAFTEEVMREMAKHTDRPVI